MKKHKTEEEKVKMEVTKSEAMFILYDRLENKWYVELQPLFVFLPGMALAYLSYLLLSKYSNDWVSCFPTLLIGAIGALLLYKQIKKRRRMAEHLYEQMRGNEGK